MSGASERAVEAATDNLCGPAMARHALHAAHDPALGLDRSICARAVYDWLPEFARQDFLDEFGGEA